MRNILGVMQGRFTDKEGFFPQEFPWLNWKNEFEFAGNHNIDCIEWMFNAERFQENPIWTKTGRNEIRRIILESDVRIHSICINYFMKNSIIKEQDSAFILEKLISAATELNIRQLIIPLFGASEIIDKNEICRVFKRIYEMLQGTKLRIGFETDISIEDQKFICQSLHTDKIGVCYDVGNAVGRGFDCVRDILEILDYLLEVHIKDKNSSGISVMLGEGMVDFREIFRNLRKREENILILESYFCVDARKDTLKNIQYVWENMYD